MSPRVSSHLPSSPTFKRIWKSVSSSSKLFLQAQYIPGLRELLKVNPAEVILEKLPRKPALQHEWPKDTGVKHNVSCVFTQFVFMYQFRVHYCITAESLQAGRMECLSDTKGSSGGVVFKYTVCAEQKNTMFWSTNVQQVGYCSKAGWSYSGRDDHGWDNIEKLNLHYTFSPVCRIPFSLCLSPGSSTGRWPDETQHCPEGFSIVRNIKDSLSTQVNKICNKVLSFLDILIQKCYIWYH